MAENIKKDDKVNIVQIKGNKYPDEYFVKFFFKNMLQEKKNLKVLEFGCGNGSNLMLPYAYGNEVIGVDCNAQLIRDANFNFNFFKGSGFTFYTQDMRSIAKTLRNLQADLFILPSVIYYISQEDFIVFLKNIIQNNNLNKNIPFYIRVRSTKDFRYGLGTEIAPNRYQMPIQSMTGESSAEIEFYTESEIIAILKSELNLREYKIFHLDNQNEHNGYIVLNSDIVVWGTIN